MSYTKGVARTFIIFSVLPRILKSRDKYLTHSEKFATFFKNSRKKISMHRNGLKYYKKMTVDPPCLYLLLAVFSFIKQNVNYSNQESYSFYMKNCHTGMFSLMSDNVD